MENKFLEYKGKQLFYRVTGSGKPVILIHGFAEDGNVWKAQVEFLQDRFRLIIPDLAGSGRSIFNPQISNLEAHADAVKAIADNENIDLFTILGHSMGGYISLAFAEKYPVRLDKLGLIHSSAYADNAEKVAARQKSIEFIKENGAHAFLKTSIPGLFSEEWSKQNQARIDELIEEGKNFNPEALISYYQAMIARPDRTPVLKKFAGPVLFIMGVHDKAVPFEQSMEQSHLPGRSHIHILRQSAHMGMWEEANKTNTALREFLEVV